MGDEGVGLRSACGGLNPLFVGSATCIPAALCGAGAPARSKARGARGHRAALSWDCGTPLVGGCPAPPPGLQMQEKVF